MKESLMRHLVCPGCHGTLDLAIEACEEDEVMEGRLRCQGCSAIYPIVRGIPRFVATDLYVGNFSFQWNVHRRTQVDSLAGHRESRKTFVLKTGFMEPDLNGKLTLDVGCGTGRYMEIAADWGAEIIGVDLSYAVDAAFANLGRHRRIHIVQADVFRLPFRQATFDAVYSIGVLHHTPSTREAFLRLPPLLKPDGIAAIWVYAWAGEYSENVDRVRLLTIHLPKPLLYAICWAAVPLLHLMAKLPLLWRVARRVPTSTQGRGLVWDVLDTFDLWGPRYQWKHSRQEVQEWFREARLAEISTLCFPISMRGRRPGEPANTKMVRGSTFAVTADNLELRTLNLEP